MTLRTMHSIRERLEATLISFLVLMTLSFLFYIIALYSFGLGLAPEVYAQIISALATALVVLLTLGLRLIDDALNRYETFAKPRINNLKTLLDVGGVKRELENCFLVNLPKRHLDLVKTSSELKKHGRFFFTKLYPQESLVGTLKICGDLEKYLGLVDELNHYWVEKDLGFESFLKFVIVGHAEKTRNDMYNYDFQMFADSGLARIDKEKPYLKDQIRTLRQTILREIEDTLTGLNSFLEAN